MLYLLLFTQLFALYFLSRRLNKKLLSFFYDLTKSKKVAVYLYALVFAPGTFIHEMSHFLAALFLLVPVGQLEIIPKFQKDKIKLGSTPIAKTDPIRRFLIGIAPLVIGLLIIFITLHYAPVIRIIDTKIKYIFMTYIVFVIGNTMFLSRRDLEGAWKFLLILVLLLIILHIIGLEFSLNYYDLIFTNQFINLLETVTRYLFVPISIDILAIVVLDKLT